MPNPSFLGMRSTNEIPTDERPMQWRVGIIEQYPNANPFQHVITRAGGR